MFCVYVDGPLDSRMLFAAQHINAHTLLIVSSEEIRSTSKCMIEPPMSDTHQYTAKAVQAPMLQPAS